MENYFFNSDFAKNSKFDYGFVGNISKKDEWNILVSQFKKYLNNAEEALQNKNNIPKKIHQIWLGDKKLPTKYTNWMNSWKLYNPDWEYKLWNENNIKDLNIKEFDIYSKKLNPGYRSDILRYILLKRFGGLYVDTDFECLKSIPSNFLNYKFIAGIMFGNKPCIGNSILMSSPNFILIDKILNYIRSIDYKNDINHIINNSGPETVTREYFYLNNQIQDQSLILPSNYFYPYPNFMINTQNDRYKEIEDISIGIHHWEMTWMKGNLFKRIKNKLKFIFK